MFRLGEITFSMFRACLSCFSNFQGWPATMASHSRPAQSCPAAAVTPITYRHMARFHVPMSCSCIRIFWFWISSISFGLLFFAAQNVHAYFRVQTAYTIQTGKKKTTYSAGMFVSDRCNLLDGMFHWEIVRSRVCCPSCNVFFCNFHAAGTNRQAAVPNIWIPIHLLQLNLQLGSKLKNVSKEHPQEPKRNIRTNASTSETHSLSSFSSDGGQGREAQAQPTCLMKITFQEVFETIWPPRSRIVLHAWNSAAFF